MSFTSRAVVAGDHPCLPGHFPDRPIVPAVLILELVAEAATAAIGPLRIEGLRSAKFLAPLSPGQTLQIHLECSEAQIRFRCEHDGRPIAQGALDYRRAG
jgi:3-hydroxyacyl-[acyl-carrier-protein] dehydratase